jgi:hypothetical protein
MLVYFTGLYLKTLAKFNRFELNTFQNEHEFLIRYQQSLLVGIR